MSAYNYEEENLLCSRNGTSVVANYRVALSKSPDEISRDAGNKHYVFAKQTYDDTMTFLNLNLEGQTSDIIVFGWSMGVADNPESNGRTILIKSH